MLFSEMCSRVRTVQPADQQILEFHAWKPYGWIQQVWSVSTEDQLSLKSSEGISEIRL